MADFETICAEVIKAEGGYQVTTIKDDRGGMTCAGISRRANPDWPGWTLIDKGVPATDPRVKSIIHAQYRHAYWAQIRGDEIYHHDIALLIYSCAVLGGVRTSSRHAQRSCGADVDGYIGKNTLEKINSTDAELFVLRFTVLRIKRHKDIVWRDRTQQKFFLGWITRDLGEIP